MTVEEQIKPIIDQVIEMIRSRCFVKGYKASDEECLGIAISKYFQWDSRIIKTCVEALHDANFHKEAEILEEIEEVYICEQCLRAYEPEEEELAEGGIRKLKTFKCYVVDLRLQQFRKLEYGKQPQFIEFNSPRGRKLLAQMHEEVTS